MGYYGDTRMRPSEIRFIQDSIASYFQDGCGTVHDAIRRIQSGYLSPDNFPPIKVVQKDWKVYSFDNRRLYVFRVCEALGCVSDIPVRIRPIWELREDRVTTFDDGRTIYVRGGTTEKHCLEHWFRQRDTAGNWNLPGQPVSVIKDSKDNVDSVDGRIDSNTIEVASVENNKPKSNIFSISHSNNNLRSTSLSSISRSDDAAEYSEDDIINNSIVPPLPNVSEQNRGIYSTNLPTSSHSSRVYIAANFGEEGFDNPNFLAASQQSFTSERKSSSDASIFERNRSSQNYPGRRMRQTAIVEQPTENQTRPHQDASKDSSLVDDVPSSEKSRSILKRIFKICCCCCPSTN